MDHPRHRTEIRILALSTALLAGCQAYAPSPLDPYAHRAAWHGRALEGDSLAAFVDRLDRVATGAAADRFDPADGLDLSEGELVALVFNPELRLARLRLARAEASAEHAGRWQDPQLSLGVMRVTESVPDPWYVNPSLLFTVPLSGRLSAERGQARAARTAAEERVAEAEWHVLLEVRKAWAEWSAAQLRSQETARLLERIAPLVEVTTRLGASGELSRIEAGLFPIEQGLRANELRRLRTETDAAEQRLRAHLGLAPEAPLRLVPSLVVRRDTGARGPTPGPTPVLVPGDFAERHPTLARLQAEYEAAEESLRGETAKQWPNLSLGPQYESDVGQSRVGFLGTIPLPLLNANRQGIAEARADRELARAAYETTYETLVGRRAAAAVRADGLAAQLDELERELVPLVDRQLEDALRIAELGEGSSLALLETLTRAHELRLELVETRLAAALAGADFEHFSGLAAPDRPTAPVEVTP